MNVKTALTLTLVSGAMLLSHNTPAQSLENKAAKSEKNAPLLEKKVLSLEGAMMMRSARTPELGKGN